VSSVHSIGVVINIAPWRPVSKIFIFVKIFSCAQPSWTGSIKPNLKYFDTCHVSWHTLFLNLSIVKERRNALCFVYAWHRALADLTYGALISVKSSSTQLDCAISCLCLICLYAFACNIVKLMGGLELPKQDNLCLFVHIKILIYHWPFQVGNVSGTFFL
jgi:hypothetical protein